MKRFSQAMLVLLTTIGGCSAQCILFDDFTTGKYDVQLSPINTTATNYSDANMFQNGTMLGGVRETAFEISGGSFGQKTELSVANDRHKRVF
jgi:hypothetical protein